MPETTLQCQVGERSVTLVFTGRKGARRARRMMVDMLAVLDASGPVESTPLGFSGLGCHVELESADDE